MDNIKKDFCSDKSVFDFKINKILFYVSKASLCKFLDITTNTLYSKIESGKWSNLEEKAVNYVYDKIVNCDLHIEKISLTKDDIEIYCVNKSVLDYVNMNVKFK